MQLKPFLLDVWLDTYEHNIEFNLAASTGPVWTVNELLDLGGEEARVRFLTHNLVYSRPAGADRLRQAIAEMQDVDVDCVQVVTGASEALNVLMWLAAEPGANVIIPRPGFTTFSALPESLGLETRFYHVRRENRFRIDVDEIQRLADANTKLILVNSPHNPTGTTISDPEMEALHDFTSQRGIQLVSDEVYHPIYHGRVTTSAARLPHATVIADLSKAFSIAGVRTGWIIEHDAAAASSIGPPEPTSPSATPPRARFSPKSPSATATSCSEKRRRPPPRISNSSTASCPTIATYWAGSARMAA
jgi:DNA-binding transcriptional MocR family regulator